MEREGVSRGKGLGNRPGFFEGNSTEEVVGFSAIWKALVPRSQAGRRKKSQAGPRLPGEESELREELSLVKSVSDDWRSRPGPYSKLLSVLEGLKDPVEALERAKEGACLSSAELFLVGNLAWSSRQAREAMAETNVRWPSRFEIPDLKSVEKEIFPGAASQLSFYVHDSSSPELARIRQERKRKERDWRAIMAEEASRVEKVLGRRPGLHEEIAIRLTQKDLIEKARLMPELGETRETLTHVHFRLKATQEAVKLEREIGRLRQREAQVEEKVRATLSQKVAGKAGDLEKALDALGEIDFLLAKVLLCMDWPGTVPEIADGPAPFKLEDAWHPLVREEVESRGGRFQPVTITLSSPVTVITGPNMGGKTVTLATVGLCVALAQWGIPVPAGKMSFSLCDFVYFSSQPEEKPGLSSFAAEIVGIKGALARRKERGLLLLDEMGSGTNPAQGLALYGALLTYLASAENSACRVLATTHYGGLSALTGADHWQVRGLVSEGLDLSMIAGANGREALEEGMKWLYDHMDYRLTRVSPEAPVPHDALLVSRLLGLEKEIVEAAEAIVAGRFRRLTLREEKP